MIDCKRNEQRWNPARMAVGCWTTRTPKFGTEVMLFTFLLFAGSDSEAIAYPEYQQFVEKNSGRTVNCAMCHSNENGPTGNGSGQIGSLTPEQFERLNKARAAMEPGQIVDSPILNEFGNKIIEAVGKKKFVDLKADPGKLASVLGKNSDLDGDGIADSDEFAEGTDPLNKLHGDPGKLFWINLNRYKMHVVLAIVAVLSVNYGLLHLIQGISDLQKRKKG